MLRTEQAATELPESKNGSPVAEPAAIIFSLQLVGKYGTGASYIEVRNGFKFDMHRRGSALLVSDSGIFLVDFHKSLF